MYNAIAKPGTGTHLLFMEIFGCAEAPVKTHETEKTPTLDGMRTVYVVDPSRMTEDQREKLLNYISWLVTSIPQSMHAMMLMRWGFPVPAEECEVVMRGGSVVDQSEESL